MQVTPFEQRVRNAIAGFEARWHGRSPTLAQVTELFAPHERVHLEAALHALQRAGYVHAVAGAWRSRPAGTTYRATESFATHARLQPTHY